MCRLPQNTDTEYDATWRQWARGAEIWLPVETWTGGGTTRKEAQSEGVFGSRPIVFILYSAPLIARRLRTTKVAWGVGKAGKGRRPRGGTPAAPASSSLPQPPRSPGSHLGHQQRASHGRVRLRVREGLELLVDVQRRVDWVVDCDSTPPAREERAGEAQQRWGWWRWWRKGWRTRVARHHDGEGVHPAPRHPQHEGRHHEGLCRRPCGLLCFLRRCGRRGGAGRWAHGGGAREVRPRALSFSAAMSKLLFSVSFVSCGAHTARLIGGGAGAAGASGLARALPGTSPSTRAGRRGPCQSSPPSRPPTGAAFDESGGQQQPRAWWRRLPNSSRRRNPV